LTLLAVLYVLSRKKLLNIPGDEKRYWDLIVSLVILLIFAWILSCWTIGIAMLAIVIYGTFYYLKRTPDSQVDQM
jgi:hypothetical protein